MTVDYADIFRQLQQERNGEVLRNHAAERSAHHVEAVPPQRRAQRGGVVSKLGHGRLPIARRGLAESPLVIVETEEALVEAMLTGSGHP